MLSHDNLTFVARTGAEFEAMSHAKESIVSYLPLSHIAGQIVGERSVAKYPWRVYFT
jgi:long-chain-fatty-acid--CoA ligase ACSBG